MKKVYINYADGVFKKQQIFALRAAKYRGNFNAIFGFTRKDIEERFYEEYKHILDQKKGGGYFLWKPYFINKTLSTLDYGDYLFYSDAGAFFLKRVDILIKELNKYEQDIMGFELPLIEKQWTKKELFINMDCDENKYYESNQLLASFILIKKTVKSETFFKEFLNYAIEEENITDKYSDVIMQSEYFLDHRHDQSIFSLLYKKNNLRPFKDPSQLGKYPTGYSDSIGESVIISKLKLLKNGRLFRINHYDEKYCLVLYHNKKGNPMKSIIKYLVKEILLKFKLYNGIVR